MGKFEIYYFSGTGNSLHIAQELQQRIPEITLIPIISLLKKETIKTNAEIVGIVFPLYLATVPRPVAEFIRKLDITSVKYVFSVTTRIGTFSVANVYINKVLQKNGKSLDSAFMINMANNSPAGLMPLADQKWIERLSKDKLMVLEEKAQQKIAMIVDSVMKREKIYSKGSVSLLACFLEPIMTKLAEISSQIPFYTDTSCTQCGICEKVCMSGKVKIINGNVVWDQSTQCYYCYACFNFCPTQSILLKNKYGLKNGRYHHAAVDYQAIAAQKISNK